MSAVRHPASTARLAIACALFGACRCGAPEPTAGSAAPSAGPSAPEVPHQSALPSAPAAPADTPRDRRGAAYLRVSANKIVELTSNGFRTVRESDPLREGGLQAIGVDRDGGLVAAYMLAGVVRVDGTHTTKIAPFPQTSIDHLRFDKKGRLWISSLAGAGYWDGKEWHVETAAFEGVRVWGLIIDDDDVPWVYGDDSVHRFDGERWIEIAHVPQINAADVDAEGGILLASRTQGVLVSPRGKNAFGRDARCPLEGGAYGVCASAGTYLCSNPSRLYIEAKQGPLDFERGDEGELVLKSYVDDLGRAWLTTTENALHVFHGAEKTTYPMGSSPSLTGKIFDVQLSGAGPAPLPPPSPVDHVARVKGRITGADGAPLAGARVAVCSGLALPQGGGSTPCNTSRLFDAKTNEAGEFVFTNMPVGTYDVAVLPKSGRWSMTFGKIEALVANGEVTVGDLEIMPLGAE